MKTFSESQPNPEAIIGAVKSFIEGDYASVVTFLRSNPDEIGEFCLQVRDTFPENDRTTPFLLLSGLIKSLL